MSTAYVLVEYDGDQVLPITGELITAAKVFESVTAVVVGAAGAHEPLVPQLAALGADAIVAAVGADTTQRVVLPAADALAQQPSDRHFIKKHHHEQQKEASTDNRAYSTRHHSGD